MAIRPLNEVGLKVGDLYNQEVKKKLYILSIAILSDKTHTSDM